MSTETRERPQGKHWHRDPGCWIYQKGSDFFYVRDGISLADFFDECDEAGLDVTPDSKAAHVARLVWGYSAVEEELEGSL